jgi:hypothetical protein
LRVVLTVRSNYAAQVRSDRTGFEEMPGDMAALTPPENRENGQARLEAVAFTPTARTGR